jgi:hypothetical protein
MKLKFLLLSLGLLWFLTGSAQTPEIGHFQQLATVKRGDTLDVAWYYKPSTQSDIRSFQVDWQYKKHLFTHISTTVDLALDGNGPVVDYKNWDNYKYNTYSNGSYGYVADTNWAVGRNYIVLPSGAAINRSGYIIHNKYKINNVPSNYQSDSIHLNWARMFRFDGSSIGDNVAVLNFKSLQVELLGNLTIRGKVWIPASVSSTGLIPTVKCYNFNTGALVASTVPNESTGLYTLNNIDKNTKYRIDLVFPTDSLASLRDRAVTIADAVKSFNEFVSADIDQNYTRQYLKHGLSYLISDLNFNKQLDGGDPYRIYASVAGLSPIPTNNLINVFKKEQFDSLVLSPNQWQSWANYINKGISITDSVGSTDLTSLDIKYFILGDVDRTHSSPVFTPAGVEVTAAVFKGNYNVRIPNTSAGQGQSLFVPMNVSTNGLYNTGMQFEMRYDKTKVRFDEVISNIPGPWLQYVTHDSENGIIRFGGMNNQKTGYLQGDVTPYRLKFSPIVPNVDITSYVYVRKLMDASDAEGDHFNISLESSVITLTNKASRVKPEIFVNTAPVAKVYPNPNNGFFELVLALPNNSWANASVFDITGRKVLDLGKFESSEYINKFVKSVNISRDKIGPYFLVVANDNQAVSTKILKTL